MLPIWENMFKSMCQNTNIAKLFKMWDLQPECIAAALAMLPWSSLLASSCIN